MVFEKLFEKFNNFYEKLFFNYGIFVAKYHAVVIIATLFLNIMLSVGIFNINIVKDADELFMVTNSEAKRNERLFKKLFKNTETVNKQFYMHQLLDMGTGAEINFRVREDPNKNILEKKYFDEILAIHQKILENVVADDNNETVRFEDVCTTRNNKCWIEGTDLLNGDGFFTFLKDNSLNLRKNMDLLEAQDEDIVYLGNNGMNFIALVLGTEFRFILDDNDVRVVGCDQTYGYARIFKIRYQIKFNAELKNKKGLLWEKEFLKYMKNMQTENLTFTFSVSKSLEEEIEANIGFDSKLTAITFFFITSFATIFMSIGSNMVTSPGIILPAAGIFSALFGVSSSIGLLSFLRYNACSLIFTIPFLVLGKWIFNSIV